MLEILNGLHEMTFKDHQCGIEGGNPELIRIARWYDRETQNQPE
jgi:hypothetical protein